MTQVGAVKIKNAILCEDIRKEVSNKLILIGVYSGNILVTKLPTNISLNYYFDTIVKTSGIHQIYIRLSGPGKDSLVLGAGIDASEDNAHGAVTGPKMEVLLEREGTIKIAVSADKKSWKTVISKAVNIVDVLPIAQPLPSVQSLELEIR